MQQNFNILLIISFFITNTLQADSSEIDDLLNAISVTNDLSEKTKMENGGISYIYTREDIQKMQAHNLKDILKSTYPFGYNENSYGLADPYTLQASIPFMSSSLRVYIDNQEITTGLYGSGMIIYGDMDINFIDHIEVYTGNPSFAFSTEPAFTIIKLYSKVAQKDEGSKVGFSGGSYNASSLYGYNTQELENGWSYFSYLSQVDRKRKQYHNGDATISRDRKTTHIFASLYDENNQILIDGIKQSRDSFVAQSLFASPNVSDIDTTFLHIGYNGSKGQLSYNMSFDLHNATTAFEDANKQTIELINNTYNQHLFYMVENKVISQSYTAGIKYHIINSSNDLLIGLNYRYKHFKFQDTVVNDTNIPDDGHTNQIISTAFLENQYSIDDNKIVTIGSAYTSVTNNSSPQDDKLISFRAGYTFTNNSIVSKTVASHIEVSLDPYLVNSITFLENPTKKTDKAKQNIILQNFKYRKGSNLYEILGNYVIIKNLLLPNKNGQLKAYNKNIKLTSILTRYIKEYNNFDKIELALGENYFSNLPQVDIVKQYFFILRSFNSYKKFDIFNELLYYKEVRHSYDYTAGVIYHKTDDLSFALKGTNILNRAKKSSYTKLSLTTLEQETPLLVSPIDSSVMITMEYTF